MPHPHSDSRAHPSNISFDLTDPTKWEAVFEGQGGASSITAAQAHIKGGSVPPGQPSASRMTPKTPNTTRAGAGGTPGAGAGAGRRSGALEGSAGGGAERAGSLILPGSTPPRTAEEDDGGGPLEPPSAVPEMPPSWVPKLSIARDAFDMRCPRGSKLTLYHRCQVWEMR